MVALTHAAPPAAVPEAVGAWLDSLADVYSDADRRRLSAAYAMARDALADAAGPDGERLVARGLGAASILAAQRLDPDSLTAALVIGLPMSGRSALVPKPFRFEPFATVNGVPDWKVVIPAIAHPLNADFQKPDRRPGTNHM